MTDKLYELVAGDGGARLLWLLSFSKQAHTVEGNWADVDEEKKWDEVNKPILDVALKYAPATVSEYGSLDGGSREKGMGKWRRPRFTNDYYPMMIQYDAPIKNS